MSNLNSPENSFQFYSVDNDVVDVISDEFYSSSSESEDELENKNVSSEISPYDEEDILEAKRLGMSLEDMFIMYQEINNCVSDEPEYTPEWPFDYYQSGYCDEGTEESYYG